MLFKKRILIIDSSDSARTILFKELVATLNDVDVIACATAQEALTATRRFEFQIITTGLTLPDMDGHDMIRQIRAQQKNRDTPIFVVSGDTQTQILDSDAEETLPNSITAYFDKAEGHKALVEFIFNFLARDTSLSARILNVDPSATSAAITNSILEKNNLNFLHVKDGMEAIHELQRDIEAHDKCTYDVLLTDLNLTPEMDGFKLIQTVRNTLKLDYLTLPVLLMTIEPEGDEKTDFTGIFGAGTNDFITRPVTEDALMERVINLINIKRQHEALQG